MLFDLETNKPIKKISWISNINSCDFTADSKYLLASAAGTYIFDWKNSTYSKIKDSASVLRVSPDGTKTVFLNEGSIRIYNTHEIIDSLTFVKEPSSFVIPEFVNRYFWIIPLYFPAFCLVVWAFITKKEKKRKGLIGPR